MITLKGKLKKEEDSLLNDTSNSDAKKRASVRDQLLVKEVQEMEQTLPPTCKVWFDNPHQLHDFKLVVSPDEGFWIGGRFTFRIFVPDDYNMAVRYLSKSHHINWNSFLTKTILNNL